MRFQRYLIRLFISWLLLAPICYFFVLPWGLGKMEMKLRLQNYTLCVDTLRQQGDPNDTAAAADNEKFCHCVIDELTIDKQDLLNIVLRRPLTRLTTYVQDRSTTCTEQQLDEARHKEPEVIYFNN